MMVVFIEGSLSVTLQLSLPRRSASLRLILFDGALLAFGSGSTEAWSTDWCVRFSGIASQLVSVASISLMEILCGARQT